MWARAGWQAERGGPARARSGGERRALHRTFVGGRSGAVSDVAFFLLRVQERKVQPRGNGRCKPVFLFVWAFFVCVCCLVGFVCLFACLNSAVRVLC